MESHIYAPKLADKLDTYGFIIMLHMRMNLLMSRCVDRRRDYVRAVDPVIRMRNRSKGE